MAVEPSFENLKRSIDSFIEDLQAINVKTIEVKDGKEILLAESTIELDGDITFKIPGNAPSQFSTEDIINMHKENVRVAVENWNRMVKNGIELVKAIMDALGFSNKLNEIDFTRLLPPR
ncbi:MAG: hypothetical protein D6752_06705 [Candidatus Nitrosothermus koennekii]|nr:MAG: hypothetical protein D6752_06705 [Candidatus Nitrosothermus koennekii]